MNTADKVAHAIGYYYGRNYGDQDISDHLAREKESVKSNEHFALGLEEGRRAFREVSKEFRGTETLG